MDPDIVRRILANGTEPPEERFVAVASELFERMSESSNRSVREVGTALNSFWNNEMERTSIWTPGWKNES
jgi:hypothetical protein